MERVDFNHYLMNGNDKRRIGSGFYFRDGKIRYFTMDIEPPKYKGGVRKIRLITIRRKRRLKYLNH